MDKLFSYRKFKQVAEKIHWEEGLEKSYKKLVIFQSHILMDKFSYMG